MLNAQELLDISKAVRRKLKSEDKKTLTYDEIIEAIVMFRANQEIEFLELAQEEVDMVSFEPLYRDLRTDAAQIQDFDEEAILGITPPTMHVAYKAGEEEEVPVETGDVSINFIELAQKRVACGYSVRKAAEIAGMPEIVLSQVEQGEYTALSLDNVKALSYLSSQLDAKLMELKQLAQARQEREILAQMED